MAYKEKLHDQPSQCTGNYWSMLRIREGDLSRASAGQPVCLEAVAEELTFAKTASGAVGDSIGEKLRRVKGVLDVLDRFASLTSAGMREHKGTVGAQRLREF